MCSSVGVLKSKFCLVGGQGWQECCAACGGNTKDVVSLVSKEGRLQADEGDSKLQQVASTKSAKVVQGKGGFTDTLDMLSVDGIELGEQGSAEHKSM